MRIAASLFLSATLVAGFKAPEYVSQNGVLEIDISIEWLTSLSGTRIAPSFNGYPVGPTIRVQPGDTLIVNVHNNLEPETEYAKALRAYTKDPTADRTNQTIVENRLSAIGEFHKSEFGYWGHNFMNLHFHGARTDTNTEDLKTSLDGGENRTYVYHFADNQPPGIGWYHNHFHGTSTYSFLSGLYGAFVIEGTEYDITNIPQVAAATEIFLFMGDSRVNETTKIPVDFVPMGGDFAWEQVTNGKLGSEAVYEFTTGETVFFRMISATVEANIPVSIDGHKMLVLTRDGYTAVPNLEELDVIELDSGSRVEFLVRFDTPGNYTMRRHAYNYGYSGFGLCVGLFGIHSDTCVSWDEDRVAATIVVRDDPNATPSPSLPTELPQKNPSTSPELVAMATQAPVRSRLVSFSEIFTYPIFQIPLEQEEPARETFGTTGYGMNNRLYESLSSAGEVVAHTCETWDIQTTTPNVGHPFHVHSVPYLVTHQNNQPVPEPFWRDTMALTTTTTTIRVCFPRSPGLLLVHCHMSSHLDVGMAANYHVVAAPTTNLPTPGPTNLPTTSPTPSPTVALTPFPTLPLTPVPTLPLTPVPTPEVTSATTPTPAPTVARTPFPTPYPTPFPTQGGNGMRLRS